MRDEIFEHFFVFSELNILKLFKVNKERIDYVLLNENFDSFFNLLLLNNSLQQYKNIFIARNVLINSTQNNSDHSFSNSLVNEPQILNRQKFQKQRRI